MYEINEHTKESLKQGCSAGGPQIIASDFFLDLLWTKTKQYALS